MLGFLAATVLTYSLECNKVMSAPTSYEAWQTETCSKLSDDYKNVYLHVLKSVVTPLEQEGRLDRLMLTEPFAGRLKVSWSENSSDRPAMYNVNLAFDGYKDAWVCGRNVKAGATLEDYDLDQRSINVAPFAGVKKIPVAKPVGQQLTKRCSKGQLLFTDSLMPKAIIRKNDVVNVVFVSKGLKIQMGGIALNDVYQLQQKVKVRVTPSGAVLLGVAKGISDVYVEE